MNGEQDKDDKFFSSADIALALRAAKKKTRKDYECLREANQQKVDEPSVGASAIIAIIVSVIGLLVHLLRGVF
jgi:hypothetical protein